MKWMTLELNEDQITLIALGLKELKKQNHFIIVGNEDKGNTFKIRLSKKFFQSTKDRNCST
ncbi:MAG: hypothetical protein KGJ07_00480 [Patescibacteria group bacterium]|nr:hypothetical protein [Patescibacteria group bacterium]